MALRTLAVAAALGLGAALGLALWPPPESFAPPRLVVLYATCSVNRSFLSPYTPSVPYTPWLDKLSERGLVFEAHHTESGQSGIAYASIFSGTQAPRHGIFWHPNRLGDERLLIAESFSAAGYDSFAFLDHPMASPSLNYAQGVPEAQAWSERLEGSDPRFRRLLRRLQREPDYKAFVVTNFTVTHGPYPGWQYPQFCQAYPQECRRRGAPGEFERYRKLYQSHANGFAADLPATLEKLALTRAELPRLRDVVEILYKADVAHLDGLFGGVLRAIEEHGLLDQSLIAFTADHGEILYRENALLRWTHGYQLAPEVLAVPWIVFGPGVGVPAGRQEAVTRSIDVFPTLAGLAGVPLEPIEGCGADLAPAIRRSEPWPELLALSHTALFDDAAWDRVRHRTELAALFPDPRPELMWVAARRRDLFFKLRRLEKSDWRVSAFDLKGDPGETRDLWDPGHADHREMSDRLRAYKEALVRAARRSKATVSGERAVELLRRLGYIE